MNIEEIEKLINRLPDIIENKSCFTLYYDDIWHRIDPSDNLKAKDVIKLIELLRDFMHMSIDLHKDHLDKIAQLEQQISELIKKDDQQILKG